jgi:hypothetical protein
VRPNRNWIAILSGMAAVLAALVSWQALSWPRPVITSDLVPIVQEVGDVRSLAQSNTLRILQNDWWRYERDIEDARQAIAEHPADRLIRMNLYRLRREQADIQEEIDALKQLRLSRAPAPGTQ